MEIKNLYIKETLILLDEKIVFCMLIFSSIICRCVRHSLSQISDNELLINPCFIQKIVSDYAFKVQSKRVNGKVLQNHLKHFQHLLISRSSKYRDYLGINFLSDNSGNASLKNNSLNFFSQKI